VQYSWNALPSLLKPLVMFVSTAFSGVLARECKTLIPTVIFRNRSNSADLHQRVLQHAEIHVPLIGKVGLV